MKFRCGKMARRCSEKHIFKSKCTKHTRFGPLFEVQMSIPSGAAVHTRDPILHAAARIDFEQHVRSLLLTGRRNEAEVLWESVVEVQHKHQFYTAAVCAP